MIATITALHNSERGAAYPSFFSVTVEERAHWERAEEDAAIFSRGAKMKVEAVVRTSGVYYRAYGQVNLIPAAGNSVNEAGIKRMRSMLKDLDRHGVTIVMETAYGNCYATLDEFLAAVRATENEIPQRLTAHRRVEKGKK